MNEGVFVVHTQTVWQVICLKFEIHKRIIFWDLLGKMGNISKASEMSVLVLKILEKHVFINIEFFLSPGTIEVQQWNELLK